MSEKSKKKADQGTSGAGPSASNGPDQDFGSNAARQEQLEQKGQISLVTHREAGDGVNAKVRGFFDGVSDGDKVWTAAGLGQVTEVKSSFLWVHVYGSSLHDIKGMPRQLQQSPEVTVGIDTPAPAAPGPQPASVPLSAETVGPLTDDQEQDDSAAAAHSPEARQAPDDASGHTADEAYSGHLSPKQAIDLATEHLHGGDYRGFEDVVSVHFRDRQFRRAIRKLTGRRSAVYEELAVNQHTEVADVLLRANIWSKGRHAAFMKKVEEERNRLL